MRLHLGIVAAVLLSGCSARRISTVPPPHFGLSWSSASTSPQRNPC